MGKYVVTNGQNLYDVALVLYGSIEGVEDLMMNNSELSLSDDLKTGEELIYTDDYVIHADVIAYYRLHQLVPSNGERRVYPKYFRLPLVLVYELPASVTSVSFSASGSGKIEIDWGDNSAVEEVLLHGSVREVLHTFDSEVTDVRIIRWYTDGCFGMLNCSGLPILKVCLLRPLVVEEFVLRGGKLGIDFLHLMQGIYNIDFQGLITSDLSPLISCQGLMCLDLSGAQLRPSVVDDYLFGLISWYGLRRSCKVIFPCFPTGFYQEPERDEHGHYQISTGMEAMWVILHEVAWNEAGGWEFVIGNEVYRSDI